LIYLEACFSKFENKAEILDIKTIKSLEKLLGSDVGSSDIEIKISNIDCKNSIN